MAAVMAWLKANWLPIGMFLLLALLAAKWRGDRAALSNANQRADAAELRLKGQVVASEETQRQANTKILDLLNEDAMLKAAYNASLTASPGATATAFARLSTGPLKVEAPPVATEPPGERPPPTPDCPKGQILTPTYPGSRDFACTPGTSPPPAPAPACVVRSIDLLSIEVSEVALRSRAGSGILTGVAAVFRDLPAPRAKLAEGKFSAALSDVGEVQAAPEPRWGGELVGTCDGTGCGFGGGVLLPPLKLWGARLETRLDVLLGPRAAAQAAAGLRF